jgi:hypothetical protein
MRSLPRALAVAALAAVVPLSIFVACGSSTFTSDNSDAATVDPFNDASLGDSQTTSDASDASDDADASPATPTWCQLNAPNAFFCADFDEGDVTKAYVGGALESILTVQQDGGLPGDIVAIGDAGKSAPSSLLTFAPVTSVTGDQLALVHANLADAPGVQSFQLDFEVRLDVVGNLTSSGPTLVLNDLTFPGTTNTFDLFQNSGTLFVNGVTTQTTLGQRLTVGVWTHFRWIISPGGQTLVSEGNGPLLDGGPSKVATTTTKPSLDIGQDESTFGGPGGGSQVSFDNVVLTAIYPDAGDGG